MNKKTNSLFASVTKQSLVALATASLVLGIVACGSDSSSSAGIECLENENCLEEDSSDSKEESSSAKESSSSSSAKKNSSSSSIADSKTSSSSSAKDVSSSSESLKESSSSVEESSSSSEEESSSSVKFNVTYKSDTPNAVDLEVSGDTLFAVFQRYTPVTFGADFEEPGLLAIYDLNDGTLLDTIQLVTKNPMAVKVIKGNVYVGTQGEYNAAWGIDADDKRGIEKIDLKNKKSELWVSGASLGGGVYLMAANKSDGKAYVTVYKEYGNAPVVEVDLASKSVKDVGPVKDATGGLYFDAEDKLLYIGDRGYMDWITYEVGDMLVRVWDGTTLSAATDEDGSLQPYSITKANGDIFVYISDYNSGALYWIDGDDFSTKFLKFSADAIIENVAGKLFVLDRIGSGSIALVDASTKTVTWQKTLEAENAYDIVAIDESSAWVAMYNTAEIRKISLSDASTIASIDTKEFSAKTVEVVE